MIYQACRPRNNPEGGTSFTNWTRVQPGLESCTSVGFVSTDVDLVWYNYLLAMLMLLELKCGIEECTPSQKTTLSVLDQHLRFASNHPDFTLHPAKGCKQIPSKIKYRGLHVLRLEDPSRDENNVWIGNGRIWIDDIQVSKEDLHRFLRFEWGKTSKELGRV